MALKARLNSLDGIEDETVQGLYKQGEDGRFYLDVEGVDEMPAVQGLKAKNTELLGKLADSKEQLKAFGDLTPDKIEELREAATKAGGNRVAELEQKLEQASANAQREISEAKEAAEAERQAARNYFRSKEATRAISQHKGNPELIAHIVERHMDVKRTDGGEFEVRVLGADGQPRIKDSAGNPFTVDDLVAELKGDDRYTGAFATRAGSDTPPGGGSGGGGGRRTISSSDPMEFGRNIEGIAKGEVTVTD